ncbi:MAG: hypothetical protein ABIF09_05650 [Gemmatimonadota bacterium]
MPDFLVRVTADSEVRVHDRAAIIGVQKHLRINFPDGQATIVVFDQVGDFGGVLVPVGLQANVEIAAGNIEEAIGLATEFAASVFSLLCVTGRASVGPARPQWAYDTSPEVEHRELRTFLYDPFFKLPSRHLKAEAVFHLLDRLFHHFLSRADVKEDRKERVMRVIQSFRRGVADNDDALSEFTLHWASLETLDVVLRELEGLEKEPILTTCAGCSTVFSFCPACGREGTFQRGTELVGVKDVFRQLGAEAEFRTLKQLRNGIVHGFRNLNECIDLAKRNSELMRTAVLTMLFRILGADSTVMVETTSKPTIKGKDQPHIKLLAGGEFEPGDLTELEGHPGLIVSSADHLVWYDEEAGKLRVKPSWSFRADNVVRVTVRGHELWGEEGRPIVLEEMDAEVVPKIP